MAFRNAWNYLSKIIKKSKIFPKNRKQIRLWIECQPITLEKISEDNSQISLFISLPTIENEGRKCLEVLTFLIESQNEFLKKCEEHTQTDFLESSVNNSMKYDHITIEIEQIEKIIKSNMIQVTFPFINYN